MTARIPVTITMLAPKTAVMRWLLVNTALAGIAAPTMRSTVSDGR
jgi:hypothetical protein